MSGPNVDEHDRPPIVSARSFFGTPLRRIGWRRVSAELTLIVAGVLVALAINNWYAGRQLRRAELGMLQQLRSALTTDLAALHHADTSGRAREGRIKALGSYLRRGAPYADSLDASFGAVLGIWGVHLNRAPYEALKVKGLDLISNDSLRTALIQLYEYVYADLDQSEGDDRNVTFEVVRPYFLREFRDIQFRESATPLDYQRLARDAYFLNVVDYRLASLRANSIRPVQRAIANVGQLLALIDRGPATQRQ